jgi:hypothetical protein
MENTNWKAKQEAESVCGSMTSVSRPFQHEFCKSCFSFWVEFNVQTSSLLQECCSRPWQIRRRNNTLYLVHIFGLKKIDSLEQIVGGHSKRLASSQVSTDVLLKPKVNDEIKL